MIQFLENLVTDDSDFIGHCPTNMERPKKSSLQMGQCI